MSSIKSIELINQEKISKQINKQFKFLNKIESLGTLSILEDRDESTFWLVTTSGLKVRPICGHRTSAGTICFQPAGSGTNHSGFGFCHHHSKKPLYNLSLSESQNYPTRLKGLLERADEIEKHVLDSLDPEIKLLSVLFNYIITLPEESDKDELSLDEIDAAKDILKEIIKAKAMRQKIMREIQLDYKNVKEFVGQIFKIIVANVDEVKSKKILNDIYNTVIIPYQNSSKLTKSDQQFHEKIQEVVAKTSKEDF